MKINDSRAEWPKGGRRICSRETSSTMFPYRISNTSDYGDDADDDDVGDGDDEDEDAATGRLGGGSLGRLGLGRLVGVLRWAVLQPS